MGSVASCEGAGRSLRWRCWLLRWLQGLVRSRDMRHWVLFAVAHVRWRLTLHRVSGKAGRGRVLAPVSCGRPRVLLWRRLFGRTGKLLIMRRQRALRRRFVVVGHA